MTLVETGTRALIGSSFGPPSEGEIAYARRLLHLLRPDMLVLWDKGFDGNDFLAQTYATGAKILGRLKSNRITPVLVRLDDGSYLSRLGTVTVRVIEAHITVTCADTTTFTGSYRLITTLTDPRRHPTRTLISLYHERWEHESAYFALRHTMMNSRVLRSHEPAGVEQEMWATLTLYQLLRTVMVDAVETCPGTDPDRAGFTVTLQAARDQLILAAPATGGLGRATRIGRRVLDALLPARRPRISTRKVKSTTVRYAERLNDGRPNRSTPVTGFSVEVQPPPEQSEYPDTTPDERTLPMASPERRSEKIIAFLRSEPERTWSAKELSRRLGDITVQSIYRQLSRLADRGLIIKTGPAAYTPTPLTTAEIR
ncbi:transposase [Streptomyces violascens]|uniref:transposase n=1 Tax=Streptomyces violascens TaxID=67381 RepID=UPI003668B0B3